MSVPPSSMSAFTLCRSYALRARRECHYLTVGARKCSTGKPRKLWHRSQRSFIVSKMIEAAMSVRFLPYYTLRACAPKRCHLVAQALRGASPQC